MAPVESGRPSRPGDRAGAALDIPVPRASPGIDDMAAGLAPRSHVRRISDSEALDDSDMAAAAALAADDDDADDDAGGVYPSPSQEISGSNAAAAGGGGNGVDAILKVAASADEEESKIKKQQGPKQPNDKASSGDAGSGQTQKACVSPLRPRPYRPKSNSDVSARKESGPYPYPPPQAHGPPYGPPPFHSGFANGPYVTDPNAHHPPPSYGPPPNGPPPYYYGPPPPHMMPPGYPPHGPPPPGYYGPPPGYYAPRAPEGKLDGPGGPPQMPRFHVPTPNSSWEDSSTQGSERRHSSPPRAGASTFRGTSKTVVHGREGEQASSGQQKKDSSASTSGSRSGPQGQKTTSTANIVSPPKSQQEEHDTSTIVEQEKERRGSNNSSNIEGRESSPGDKISTSNPRSRESSPGSSSKASPGQGYASSQALDLPPAPYAFDQSSDRHHARPYPQYRYPGRQYKLPPASPMARVKDDGEQGSKDGPMASPTIVPYRPSASKPSPAVSRSFSSEQGVDNIPPPPSYGAAGVPPPSPIRSNHRSRDGAAPPTPLTPRTPSRHDASYEGPYIDSLHSGSWGYSQEHGPPPAGGPGYPQTPKSYSPHEGGYHEGYPSYYQSPGPGYEYPAIATSASYDSAYPPEYGYNSYQHHGLPYPVSSDGGDHYYDPGRNPRLYPSASYDSYGTSSSSTSKRHRKAAKTTAIDPNDPTMTTGVSILTGNMHVPPPDSASEVDFDIHKPPTKPVTKEGTRSVCASVSELNAHDVLLGRGGGTNTQVGNRHFRSLVTDFQPTYLMAKRKEKPLLARSIVLIIRKRGGRFLKKDDTTGKLYEVGDEKAEAKTSQALREGLDVRATKSAANALLKQEKEAKKRRKAAARNKGKKDKYFSEAAYPDNSGPYGGPPTPYYPEAPYSYSPGGYYSAPPHSPYGVPSSLSFDHDSNKGAKREREYSDQYGGYEHRGHVHYPPSGNYFAGNDGKTPTETDRELMIEFAPPKSKKQQRSHSSSSPPSHGEYQQKDHTSATPTRRGAGGNNNSNHEARAAVVGVPQDWGSPVAIKPGTKNK